jgi:hypothetical protein
MTIRLLSVEGERRRDEILALAIEESHRIQRNRKRRRKFAGAALTVLLVAAAVWIYLSRPEPSSHQPLISDVVDARNPSTAPATSDLERHVVSSRIDDLERYLVRTRQVTAEILLDDTQLLRALKDLGRVEGIVRVDGKTWLASELKARAAVDD